MIARETSFPAMRATVAGSSPAAIQGLMVVCLFDFCQAGLEVEKFAFKAGQLLGKYLGIAALAHSTFLQRSWLSFTSLRLPGEVPGLRPRLAVFLPLPARSSTSEASTSNSTRPRLASP